MNVIVKIKESVIDDFFTYIKKLKKADYSMDTTLMLDKILFIETAYNIDDAEYFAERLLS